MKRNSTILHFALLLLVGTAGAYSDANCSQTVNWIIKNGTVSGNQYTFEVWARATDEPVPVNGTSQSSSNAVCVKWNPNALQLINNAGHINISGRWKYPYYSCISGWESAHPEMTFFQFWVWPGGSPSLLSQDLPDGEMVFSMTLTVLNASLDPGLAWDTDISYHQNTGILGASNTFTVGTNGPLPIQLASFKATTLTGNGVTMTWTTVSETNNYGFNVQRNGANIAFIQGHGTTIEQHTYSYTDSPGPGKYQYRLQQVDLNGTATLSESIPVDVAGKFALEQNYPNPFNPSTQIAFSTTKEGPVSLRVYDILGREVATLVNENRKPGEYTERFDGSRLASGVYMYVLKSSEGHSTSRMILSK